MAQFYNIVTDCLDKHILKYPKETALIVARETTSGVDLDQYSYLALYEKSLKIADSLHQMGGRPGDRVLIRLPNGLFFCSIFFGIMRAGLIPVPISTSATLPEVSFMLHDSGAKFIFIDNSLPLNFDDYKGFPVWVDVSEEKEVFLESPSQEPMGLSTSAEAPAFWLYTSGTEGVPKAVIHAHRNIPAHDHRVKNWQDLGPDAVVFNTSALNWSYALTAGFLDCWRHKVPIVTYRGGYRANLILDVIKKAGVTHLLSVPGIYRRLIQTPELKDYTQKLKVVLSAGEKLPEAIREKFQEQTGIIIREGLGMTEQSVFIFQSKNDPVIVGSCGKPVVDGAAVVLNDDLSLAEPGSVGILASSAMSGGLMLGYHNRPSEMDKVFQGDYFLSGDYVKKDEQGNFFYVSRRDEVITAGGYRVSPIEVEGVLNSCEGVLESAVIGVELEPGKTVMKAFLVIDYPDQNVILEKIKKMIAEKLARYKWPRDYIFVTELPKTTNGKLKRKELFNLKG